MKIQTVAKLKYLIWDKTQNLSFHKTEGWNFDKAEEKKLNSWKNQFLTRSISVRTIWHLDNGWDVLGQHFAISRCFCLLNLTMSPLTVVCVLQISSFVLCAMTLASIFYFILLFYYILLYSTIFYYTCHLFIKNLLGVYLL